jgi:endonuclease/exonuclease/phosphatase (EEP) superfamily protein YafD
VSKLKALQPRTGGRLGAAVSLLAWLCVAAVLALIVGGRTVSAPPTPIAASIVFLPYAAAALAALIVLAWILFPDRRSIPGALLTLGAISAAVWGPRWGGDGPEVEGTRVRVMSWNLRRLWGGPVDGDAMKCAVGAIEQLQPDVLTLLEVSAEDVKKLQAAVPGMVCAQHSYQEGGGPKTGGLATCTRGEVWRLKSGEGQRFVDHEDWYYVLAEVEHRDRVFNVLAVHLAPYRYVAKKLLTSVEELKRGEPAKLVDLSRQTEGVVRGQADQSAALLERVDKFADPTVVAGDFNSTRDSAIHAALRRKLKDTWEVGGLGFGGTVHLFDYVPLRVDYVYASDAFHVTDTVVPVLGCSDHRPVVSNLTLKALPDRAAPVKAAAE